MGLAPGDVMARKMRRRTTILIWVVVVVALVLWRQFGPGLPTKVALGDAGMAAAFAAQQSDVMVEFTGRVQRLLPEDLDASPHQRFIVELDNEQAVLVEHDLKQALKVPFEEWDTLTVHGEYEWNEQGGIVRWTHRDPGIGLKHGWIEYRGQRYE